MIIINLIETIRYSDICKLKYFKKVFGKNKLKKIFANFLFWVTIFNKIQNIKI